MTLTGDSKVRVRSLEGHSPPDGCDVDSYVEVNSPTASLIFAASDEKNQDKWVDAFRKVISTIKELQDSGDKGRKPRDVRGMHSFNVHGSTFHVDKKYKLIKPIGHGAYVEFELEAREYLFSRSIPPYTHLYCLHHYITTSLRTSLISLTHISTTRMLRNTYLALRARTPVRRGRVRQGRGVETKSRDKESLQRV